MEEAGTKAICEALEQNKTLKELDISGEKFGKSNIGGTAGAKHVAKMVGINGGLTSIDLSRNQLCGILRYVDVGQQGSYTSEGITAITNALRVNGGLTVTNLLGNQLDAESAKMLAEVAKQKGISLCGIQRDQTTADFSNQNLKLPDAIMLASDLSQAVVTRALTRVDVRQNNIAGDGPVQLATAVLGNLKIEMFNEIPIKEMRANSLTELDLKGKDVGVEGGMVVAGLIPVMGALTKLSLAWNKLEEEGTKAICEALEQNKTLKELDISGNRHGNIGGSAGAKHVAKMLGVNGGLTSIDLSDNQLCGIRTDYRGGQHGAYTAEGITAIADAMRVNGALIECDLSNNGMGKEGKASILSAAQGKAGFNLHL